MVTLYCPGRPEDEYHYRDVRWVDARGDIWTSVVHGPALIIGDPLLTASFTCPREGATLNNREWLYTYIDWDWWEWDCRTCKRPRLSEGMYCSATHPGAGGAVARYIQDGLISLHGGVEGYVWTSATEPA